MSLAGQKYRGHRDELHASGRSSSDTKCPGIFKKVNVMRKRKTTWRTYARLKKTKEARQAIVMSLSRLEPGAQTRETSNTSVPGASCRACLLTVLVAPYSDLGESKPAGSGGCPPAGTARTAPRRWVTHAQQHGRCGATAGACGTCLLPDQILPFSVRRSLR